MVSGSLAVAVAGAQTKPDSDPFQAGSAWTGTLSGDPRKPGQDHDRGATLRVMSRNGEMFEAEFVVRGNAAFALALEGRFANGQLVAKVTKIIKGRWPNGTVNDVWTGGVSGEELVLKHTNKQNLVATATLKLDPSAGSGRRGKGKQK
jgi:hypothetical protein